MEGIEVLVSEELPKSFLKKKSSSHIFSLHFFVPKRHDIQMVPSFVKINKRSRKTRKTNLSHESNSAFKRSQRIFKLIHRLSNLPSHAVRHTS